jgi:hypothetical protein
MPNPPPALPLSVIPSRDRTATSTAANPSPGAFFVVAHSETSRAECASDRLTSLKTNPTLRIPAALNDASSIWPVKDSSGSFLRSRLLSVLLPSVLHRAGVFSGLDSATSNPEPRQPTRQRAWWVFSCREQGTGNREQGTILSSEEKRNSGIPSTKSLQFHGW